MIKDTPNFIVQSKEGLYCQYADIWIDPFKPVKRAIITHAHFDHMAFGCGEYISSIETGLLIKERLGNNINLRTYDYDDIFSISGIKFSLYPSGHILGASQIKIENGSDTWLITGDFKRQLDKTCKSFIKLKTDFLICESTFGLPIFNWEPTEKIIKDISSWVNESEEETSILFCYSLGKAQRLLSELCNQQIKNIYVHKSIHKINKIYKNLGIDLSEIKVYENNASQIFYKNDLILLPPSLNNEKFLKRFKKVQTGFASGWMSIRALRKRSGFDKGFAISDHADWNGLVKTILESKAQTVFLNHGDGESLAKYIRNKHKIKINPLTNFNESK